MQGHHHGNVRVDGRLERYPFALQHVVDAVRYDVELEVAVYVDIALAGKMLGAGHDAGRVEAADEGGGEFSRTDGVAAEVAVVLDRQPFLVAEVHDGRETGGDADGGELDAGDPAVVVRGLPGFGFVADRREGHVAGTDRDALCDRGELAAFLVDGDEHGDAETVFTGACLHLFGKGAELEGVDDVAARKIQDGTDGAFFQQLVHVGGNLEAVHETGHHQLSCLFFKGHFSEYRIYVEHGSS